MNKTNHFRKELYELEKRANKDNLIEEFLQTKRGNSINDRPEYRPALRLPYSSDFEPVGDTWK